MKDVSQGAGFSTLAIHAGTLPDPTTRLRVTPIYQTTSDVFDDVDHAAFGNVLARISNPTIAVLEERIAALEGGTAAVAVASGHAAQMLAFHALLQPGDELIATRPLTGGPIDPLAHALKRFGWTVRRADTTKLESLVEALSDRTKAIFIESIAEPGGGITDIEAVAAVARRARVPLVVDNTLATPYLVRPFEHGADVVVHSASKFLGGHGNAIGGLVVDGGSFNFVGDGRYPALSRPSPCYGDLVIAETFGNFAFAIGARVLGLRDLGASLSPFNAFLILTGIETLPLRMQRHCDNALAVARHLDRHARVKWVRYAGLETDSDYALGQRYSPKGAGAVFAFGVDGYEAAVTLVERLRLFSRGADFGETRSLVIHPASASHRRLADGADPDAVRVAIGLEDVADIIADLDQALAS